MSYSAEDAIALVPEVIGVLESFEPAARAQCVPNHLVAGGERTRQGVLVGEGADELFAGYSHYGRHATGAELHGELLDTIAGMHMGGLQRVDRVTSANALEPRIPFLDLDVVELALALPPAWKLVTEARPAKWLLRRAFEGCPSRCCGVASTFGGHRMNESLRVALRRHASDEQLLEREASTRRCAPARLSIPPVRRPVTRHHRDGMIGRCRGLSRLTSRYHRVGFAAGARRPAD